MNQREGMKHAIHPFAIFGAVCGAVLLGGCAEDAPATRGGSEGYVYLVAFGEVETAELARAGAALYEATGRLPLRAGALPLPAGARRADGAYDAGKLLDALILIAPDDTFRILGVADAPLRAPAYEYVIGYARYGERAMVYSTERLHATDSELVRQRRVRRIVAHELGHTYGAHHCHGDCIMRATPTARKIDALPDHYCAEHERLRRRALLQGRRHPDTLAAVGHERMRLGLFGDAVRAYHEAIAQRPNDPRLYTALGLALTAAGALSDAADAFGEAQRLAPSIPQPYYAQAVLFGAGLAPLRAPAFLEAAVSRDGDPIHAHRAAGIVYQDLLGNTRQAVRHYERHLSLGGRDRTVIARLVYLLAPRAITFGNPERIIARWSPERGLVLARAGP